MRVLPRSRVERGGDISIAFTRLVTPRASQVQILGMMSWRASLSSISEVMVEEAGASAAARIPRHFFALCETTLRFPFFSRSTRTSHCEAVEGNHVVSAKHSKNSRKDEDVSGFWSFPDRWVVLAKGFVKHTSKYC